MFPKSRGFNRVLSVFLAFFTALTLTGCESIPPEAADALRAVPSLLSRVADALYDLAGQLDTWLDAMTSDPLPVPEESSFAVHFIDVGQADCALVA